MIGVWDVYRNRYEVQPPVVNTGRCASNALLKALSVAEDIALSGRPRFKVFNVRPRVWCEDMRMWFDWVA